MLYYDLYEQDSKLQCNLKKVSKLTFKATHRGNNKQDASLTLEIFDQTTPVLLKVIIQTEKMLEIFLLLISSTTFIKILSFHCRSLNGTT